LAVLPLPAVQGKPVVSLEGEQLLELELLYDEITETEIISRTHTQIVRIQATQNPDEVKRKDEVIPWVALQRAGKVLDQLTGLMEVGNIAAAISSLQDAIAVLRAYGPGAPVAEAIQQLEATLKRIEGGGWSLRERKTSKYLGHSYRRMSSRELWSGPGAAPSFKQPPPPPPPPPATPGDQPPTAPSA
jgi:hypothetical protein